MARALPTVENPCRGCGGDAPVLEVFGESVRMPYCEECAERLGAADDQEARDRTFAAYLRRAGATPRLLLQSLDTFPPDGAEHVEAARQWLDGRPGNLWISGPLGVGKSGIAWGIVRAAAEMSFGEQWDAGDRDVRDVALFLRWADLLDDLRSAFDGARESERRGERPDPSQLLERARSISLLVLDDLGRERPTPWALEQLAGLVEHRYQRLVPTVITSNYTSRELAERLAGDARATEAERIVSRLVEGASRLRMEGKSRRRAAV